MNDSSKQWKECAIELAKALGRTSYYKCEELNHYGGNYHEGNEPCPIVEMCRSALANFDKLSKGNKNEDI